MYMTSTCLIWRSNKERNSLKSFNCQSFFLLWHSLAWAALLVSGSCMRTAQVAVVVWALPISSSVRLKSLSSFGLSSAELAPAAIPSERATPQSGAPNSSQCWNAQWPTWWDWLKVWKQCTYRQTYNISIYIYTRDSVIYIIIYIYI